MPEDVAEAKFRRIKPVTLLRKRLVDGKDFYLRRCMDDVYKVLYFQQWVTCDSDWEFVDDGREEDLEGFLGCSIIYIRDAKTGKSLWHRWVCDIPTSLCRQIEPERKKNSLETPLFECPRDIDIELRAVSDVPSKPVFWTLKMVVEYLR